MDVYGPLFRSVLFPTWEGLIRRRPTLTRLRYLEATQWLPLEKLVELQLRELRNLVRHAMRHVPYYRDRFRLAGVDPRNLRTTKDLLRLPLLSREDAQSSQSSRRSTAAPFVEIRKTTSGSLGVPVSFGYERDSEHWRQAVRLRSYAWAGHRPGARTFHMWGTVAPPTGLRKAKIDLDRRLRRDVYFDCSVRSPQRLDDAILRMKHLRPQALICFSSAGADLARRVLETGARSWSGMPVICGAEALLPSDRMAMEEAFGPVFETYGSREVMLMGAECPERDGLHVAMENVIVELIVRDGDEVRHAAPGELGEVAVTDLHNRAMPFIRYLNGDRAVAGDESRCRCGRELVRLRSIDGRVAATLRDVAGAPVGSIFVHVLLARVGHAFRAFQAVQHADRSVTLRLVKSAAFDELAHRCLVDGFGVHLKGAVVKSEFLEEIPAGKNGKRQVIVCEA